jgi:hypothetical protein
MSATPELFEFLRKKFPVAGSYSPTVSTPSPSQSPTSGTKLAAAGPYENVISAGPAEFEFFRKNVPVVGLYRPTVAIPSPSQSPTSGIQPEPPGPYPKLISAAPPVFEFLRKNPPLAGAYNPAVVSLGARWLTVNERPATVRVADRAVPVFLATVYLKEPLPVPEPEVIVIHVGAPEEVQAQPCAPVTVTVAAPPLAPNEALVDDMLNEQLGAATDIVPVAEAEAPETSVTVSLGVYDPAFAY